MNVNQTQQGRVVTEDDIDFTERDPNQLNSHINVRSRHLTFLMFGSSVRAGIGDVEVMVKVEAGGGRWRQVEADGVKPDKERN